MKKLAIIGAGGHGKVIAEIAERIGYSEVIFLDDDLKNSLASGTVDKFQVLVGSFDFFVAIGNNEIRENIFNEIEEKNGNIVNLIHPSATISTAVELGKGVAVMAGAVINTGAYIGNGCIINTASSVDHDCILRDFIHISVGAHLAGTVKVGERTFIGAGATVINNISITNDCIIGAGAVVVNNIDKKGTYIGIPARLK